jgi:hypothetical protein
MATPSNGFKRPRRRRCSDTVRRSRHPNLAITPSACDVEPTVTNLPVTSAWEKHSSEDETTLVLDPNRIIGSIIETRHLLGFRLMTRCCGDRRCLSPKPSGRFCIEEKYVMTSRPGPLARNFRERYSHGRLANISRCDVKV